MKILKENNKILLEAKLRELISQTTSQTPKLYARSSSITPKYLGISKFGILNFQTNSQTHNDEGAKWYQTVEIVDLLGKIDEIEDITAEDVTDLFATSDVKIYCDDPSFLYWAFQYKATMKDYVDDEHPETRAPQRNNRRLKGALCKHLAAVINLILSGELNEQIARDITNYRSYQAGDKYQSFNRGRLMHQATTKKDRINWQDASSFMNDYLASKAGINSFLDDKDIKGSLAQEIDRINRTAPNTTLDEFITDEFGVEGVKGLADELGIDTNYIEKYFKDLRILI